ncbi:phage tail protein [Streptomyces sp. BA2]|uniref:phage tail protein n=1 Tax=Streptomyces sp. BA2 TaxID=436595 RepID=UPI0013264B42|nr:phage tail protein [Streptomyces sp. BA2]MWA07833.1 phage tail protein [Streptomyces sp. BA2]
MSNRNDGARTGSDPARSHHFRLTIDGQDLGRFTSCEGLACSVEVEEFAEGGSNGFSWYLPKRLAYPPLLLSRPVHPGVRQAVSWVTAAVAERRRTTGEIAALTNGGAVLARWGLLGVVPVSWSGPSFDVRSATAAMEVLEIVHHGFFEPGGR